jgi:protein-tyrosine phosphatase
VRGYRTLLAHPERNPTLNREPTRLTELVGRGVLLQVTADALVPRPMASRSRRLARSLVADGIAHVLASDAHASRERDPLNAGLTEARGLVGAHADWMVEEAPAAILAGDALPPRPAALRPVRRHALRRLKRR